MYLLHLSQNAISFPLFPVDQFCIRVAVFKIIVYRFFVSVFVFEAKKVIG